MSTRTHLVIGTGVAAEASYAAITESIKDAVDPENDILVVPWTPRPADAMKAVYDFIVKTGVRFVMIHPGASKVPAVFTSAEANGDVLNVPDMGEEYVRRYNLTEGGYCFVLGEDEATEMWLLSAFSHSGEKLQFVDLGRGLVPVSIQGDAPTESEQIAGYTQEMTEQATAEQFPTAATVETTTAGVKSPDAPEVTDDDNDEEDAPEDKADIYSFKKEELESIPLRVLKNIAARVWDEVPNTVDGIIEKVEATRPSSCDLRTAGPPEGHYGDQVEDAFKRLYSLLNYGQPSTGKMEALRNVHNAYLWYKHSDTTIPAG